MKLKELKPSKAVLAKVRKLAHNDDNWMTPTDDNFTKEAKKDFGEYEGEHQQAWEETCHFDHFYRQPITELGYRDAYKQGFVEADYSEPALAFHEMFLQPLLTAFWEEWAEVWELHKYWETNVRDTN